MAKKNDMNLTVNVELLFSFSIALEYLKQGFKVSKKSWHKEGMYIQLQEPTELSKMTDRYLYITIDDEYRNPWHPSQADILEEDWQVVK